MFNVRFHPFFILPSPGSPPPILPSPVLPLHIHDPVSGDLLEIDVQKIFRSRFWLR